MRVKIFIIPIIIITMFANVKSQILLFPQSRQFSAETFPYTQMLHTGVENDTFYMRGRFGVDFPVVGYAFDERQINFGITAATHINMRPTSGGRFPVDNFYAVLSIFFSGDATENIHWRLYPVYHVSAHLADGYRGGAMLFEDVRAVSSEMVRGEIYYTFEPLRNLTLELGGGAGWYYHVCAQKDLSHKFDASLLVSTNHPLIESANLRPFALLRGETIYQGKYYGGVDVKIGAITFTNTNNRGLGLALRYFNRLHSSYYFEQYEVGWGGELLFFL